MRKADEKQIAKNTETVLNWLKSSIGQEALQQTEKDFPNMSKYYSSRVGMTLGKYATHLGASLIDNVDVDKIHIELFGETDKQKILRENAAKGGAKSKGGGRPPKADADPKRRERYLKSKENKNDSTE